MNKRNMRFREIATKKHSKPLEEQDWVYLLHHIHKPERNQNIEILHHCHFFDKKNMKGKIFYQKHVKDDRVFQHVIDLKKSKVKLEDVPDTLYCHLNNAYKIRTKKIAGEKHAVFTGMVNLKKTKWSEQDR